MWPGATIFCTGTASCNNRCKFCQNWHLSQRSFEEIEHVANTPVQTVVFVQSDGSFPQILKVLARIQLLVFDDWLRDPLTPSQSQDLLEILDDRYGRSATLVSTQVPVSDWHSRIPDPTIADSVLDRLIHNAYRLELKEDSMRKIHSPLQKDNN